MWYYSSVTVWSCQGLFVKLHCSSYVVLLCVHLPECNCHGKSEECYYNQTVADAKLSLNVNGAYEGGGVCLGCSDNTGGINCQSCVDGYYRPSHVSFLLFLSENLFGPHCALFQPNWPFAKPLLWCQDFLILSLVSKLWLFLVSVLNYLNKLDFQRSQISDSQNVSYLPLNLTQLELSRVSIVFSGRCLSSSGHRWVQTSAGPADPAHVTSEVRFTPHVFQMRVAPPQVRSWVFLVTWCWNGVYIMMAGFNL